MSPGSPPPCAASISAKRIIARPSSRFSPASRNRSMAPRKRERACSRSFATVAKQAASSSNADDQAQRGRVLDERRAPPTARGAAAETSTRSRATTRALEGELGGQVAAARRDPSDRRRVDIGSGGAAGGSSAEQARAPRLAPATRAPRMLGGRSGRIDARLGEARARPSCRRRAQGGRRQGDLEPGQLARVLGASSVAPGGHQQRVRLVVAGARQQHRGEARRDGGTLVLRRLGKRRGRARGSTAPPTSPELRPASAAANRRIVMNSTTSELTGRCNMPSDTAGSLTRDARASANEQLAGVRAQTVRAVRRDESVLVATHLARAHVPQPRDEQRRRCRRTGWGPTATPPSPSGRGPSPCRRPTSELARYCMPSNSPAAVAAALRPPKSIDAAPPTIPCAPLTKNESTRQAPRPAPTARGRADPTRPSRHEHPGHADEPVGDDRRAPPAVDAVRRDAEGEAAGDAEQGDAPGGRLVGRVVREVGPCAGHVGLAEVLRVPGVDGAAAHHADHHRAERDDPRRAAREHPARGRA